MLEAAGYTADGLKAALGSPPRIGLLYDEEVHRHRLRGSDLETLALLFAVGLPVSVHDARRALAPLELEPLAEAGLLQLDGGHARARLGIGVYEDLYVIADHRRQRRRPDYVTGPNLAARMLAQLTIRRPVSDALDLGVGSGIQSLLATRHAERVVGVDTNKRALGCAELNVRLNGARGIELRTGSWFEPVGDAEFDLIIANPPFVVSPETDLAYRDSDLPRDEASLNVIRGAATRLAEGGFAHVECNWVHPAAGDWREPLESAFAGTGCDAVLLKFDTFDPVDYAASWLGSDAETPASFRDAVDRWLEYYRESGIEAISWGVVTLRKHSLASNFIRAFELPRLPARAAGAHLERLFTGRDHDGDLIGSRLPEGARFEHRFEPGERGHTLVTTADSVGFAARIDPDAAAALARDADTARFGTDLRRLLELGFLVPPAC